jgi:hypothetical protein
MACRASSAAAKRLRNGAEDENGVAERSQGHNRPEEDQQEQGRDYIISRGRATARFSNSPPQPIQ